MGPLTLGWLWGKIIKFINKEKRLGEKERMKKMNKAAGLLCVAAMLAPVFSWADDIPRMISKEERNGITQAARQELLPNYEKLRMELLPEVTAEEVMFLDGKFEKLQRFSAGEKFFNGHESMVVPQGEVRYVGVDVNTGEIFVAKPSVTTYKVAPVHGMYKGKVITPGSLFINGQWIGAEQVSAKANHRVFYVSQKTMHGTMKQALATAERKFTLSPMRQSLIQRYGADIFSPLNESAAKLLRANDIYLARTAEIGIVRAAGLKVNEAKLVEARQADIEWRKRADEIVAKNKRVKATARYRGFFFKGLGAVAIVAGLEAVDMLLSRMETSMQADAGIQANAQAIAQSVKVREEMTALAETNPQAALWLPLQDKEYILLQRGTAARENLLGAMLQYGSFALNSLEEGSEEYKAVQEAEQIELTEMSAKKELAALIS